MADHSIVVTIDKAYEPWCGVMLSSLFDQHPADRFKVYILSTCTATELTKLSEFIHSRGHKAVICSLSPELLARAPVSHHVSLATYFRLLIPEVLPGDEDQVLFLDSDMLICRPIDLLWKIPLSRHGLLAVENPLISKAFKQNLGMQPEFDYFNAGLMMINLEFWRTENITQKAAEFLKTSTDRITFWDQDVLNYLFQGKWHKLPYQLNAQEIFFLPAYGPQQLGISETEFELIRNHPHVVHFTGGSKPWLPGTQHPWKEAFRKVWENGPWAPAEQEN
jgi:lipopolysaccharide biosynthesis glycosyltransferase